MICSTVYRPNTRNDYDRVENSQKKITNEDKKYYEQWLEPLDSMRERPEFDHFIYTRMMGGGLGNQMYRFAGLYAMGKMLNRTPVYVHEEFKMHEIDKELAYVFPNYHSKVYFLKKDFKDFHQFHFAQHCCDYHDPKILLEQNKGRGLYLAGGPNFLDTRYIEHMRPQILKIFEFGRELVSKVSAIKDKIISKVHYIINLNLTRGEELNFATQICDSFLVTAAMSTYATWMGYLMPDDRPIFFIRRLMQNPTIDTLYMLPESWIPIDENWLKD
uniref:L-Fucosyltransferase n=1 Tax=Meloidogyne javanica TaxID=6303 RepID=A0A915N3I2_MELJA